MTPFSKPSSSGAILDDPRHIVVFCVRGMLTPAEPFLRPLRRRGLHVTWVSGRQPSEVVREPRVETLAFEDFASEEKFHEAIAARHAERPITGVVSFVEDFVPLAARLGARLGLPLNSERTATATTNKYEMRLALAEGGTPIPAFHYVSTADDAVAAAAAIGFPCVVKPLRASGSRGVKVVENAEEVRAAFAWTARVAERGSGRRDALIEEYARGTEYSAELVVANGTIVFESYTEKHLVGGPYRDEVAHIHPTYFDASTAAALHSAMQRTVRAVGIRNSGCHVEFKIDGSKIAIIEIASRLGGAGIPELVRSSTGVDMIDLVYAAVLGEPIAPVAPPAVVDRYYGIWFVSTTEPARLRTKRVPRRAYGFPGVFRAEIITPLGARVVPEESGAERVGYIIGRHADRATLVSSLRAAARTIAAEVLEPDDAAGGHEPISPPNLELRRLMHIVAGGTEIVR
jgi:biotin carboxylase